MPRGGAVHTASPYCVKLGDRVLAGLVRVARHGILRSPTSLSRSSCSVRCRKGEIYLWYPIGVACHSVDKRRLAAYSLRGAEGQIEFDILFVQGCLGGEVGGDETDVERVFIGADFGDAWQSLIKRDA